MINQQQLAIKVGNNEGQDWVVVVADNGCIFLDTGSYATFHLPVFIVQQSGQYYRVSKGNRILLLGTGCHLVLYTKQVPILFVRKHTTTHQKSIPLTAIPTTSINSSPLKSDSLESNEPLKQIENENKRLLQKVMTEEDNKKKEESKEEPKEEQSKEESKTEEPQITAPNVIKTKSEEEIKSTPVVIPPKPELIKQEKQMLAPLKTLPPNQSIELRRPPVHPRVDVPQIG